MKKLDIPTIALVVFLKAFLLVFGAVVCAILLDRNPSFPYGWLELWNRWDAPHFIDIARYGYSTSDTQRVWIVFYPLYPWAVRVVAAIARDFVVSAHLLSLAGAIATALVFQRLVELDFDRALARSAVVFMFTFPTAYFFHIGYTESLFMALTLSCVLAARSRRWRTASLFGALASMTRVNGLLLLPVLATEAFLQYREEGRRLDLRWLAIPFASLGFLIYLWINWHLWGDPFYFQLPMRQVWSKTLAWPWIGIARTAGWSWQFSASRSQLFGTQELVFTAVGLLCTIWSWCRLRVSYSVWMTLNFLLMTSTSVMMSTPRYLLSFFPMFILFALAGAKRPMVGAAITIWSLAFFGFFAALFCAGQWAY